MNITPQQPLPADWPQEWQAKTGDRICDECLPRAIKLVTDFSRAGFEWRCPRCGSREEFFGRTLE